MKAGLFYCRWYYLSLFYLCCFLIWHALFPHNCCRDVKEPFGRIDVKESFKRIDGEKVSPIQTLYEYSSLLTATTFIDAWYTITKTSLLIYRLALTRTRKRVRPRAFSTMFQPLQSTVLNRWMWWNLKFLRWWRMMETLERLKHMQRSLKMWVNCWFILFAFCGFCTLTECDIFTYAEVQRASDLKLQTWKLKQRYEINYRIWLLKKEMKL